MDWRTEGGELLAQREGQGPPDFAVAIDTASQTGKTADMVRTAPGDPPVGYDVRSTYDARPVNSRDFNITGKALGTVSGSGAIVFPVINFVTPPGWRFVVRRWDILFSPSLPTIGGNPIFQNTTANLLQGGGAADPFNQAVVIGTQSALLRTFMIVEEQTQFGIQIVNVDTTLTIGGTSTAIVNIYGNAIPVLDVQLPYSIANPVRGLMAPPMVFPAPEPTPAAAAAAAGLPPAEVLAALPANHPAVQAARRAGFAVSRQHGYTSLIRRVPQAG